MNVLGIILVLASFAYGLILCRAAARSPRCRVCRIPAEPTSRSRGAKWLPLIETVYWCPRCARVVSRRLLTPHWE